MSVAEAGFDVLYLSRRLGAAADGPIESEYHSFAYLACLLSVVQGYPASAWGYEFAATSVSAPFSTELSSALERLVVAGMIARARGLHRLTPLGSRMTEALEPLHVNSTRKAYLDGACGSLMTLPITLVMDSLAGEPQLEAWRAAGQQRMLLNAAGINLLHSHRVALQQVLGSNERPAVVASVWTTYLQRVTKVPGAGEGRSL